MLPLQVCRLLCLSVRHEQYYCRGYWYWLFWGIDIGIDNWYGNHIKIDIDIEIDSSQLQLIDKQLILISIDMNIGIDIDIEIAYGK